MPNQTRGLRCRSERRARWGRLHSPYLLFLCLGKGFEVLKGLIIFKEKVCTLLVLSAFVRIESIYSEQNHILRLFDLPESWRQWGANSKTHRNEISVRAWEGVDLWLPFQKLNQLTEPFEVCPSLLIAKIQTLVASISITAQC